MTLEPHMELLASSHALGWTAITLEHCRFPAGKNFIPPSPRHLIGIHCGAPLRLFQQRDSRRTEAILTPGELVLVPAGMENLCAHHAPAEGMYLSLDPHALATTAGNVGLHGDRLTLKTTFGQHDPILSRIAEMLVEEVTSVGVGGSLLVEALTLQLHVHLLRHYLPATPTISAPSAALPTGKMKQAVAFIKANLGASLSLTEIAASVHLTPFHFSRMFKQATGLAPHQYVIQARVEAAQRLLRHGNLSLAQIASEVGFADQGHLTRHFKRLTGMTPKQARVG